MRACVGTTIIELYDSTRGDRGGWPTTTYACMILYLWLPNANYTQTPASCMWNMDGSDGSRYYLILILLDQFTTESLLVYISTSFEFWLCISMQQFSPMLLLVIHHAAVRLFRPLLYSFTHTHTYLSSAYPPKKPVSIENIYTACTSLHDLFTKNLS